MKWLCDIKKNSVTASKNSHSSSLQTKEVHVQNLNDIIYHERTELQEKSKQQLQKSREVLSSIKSEYDQLNISITQANQHGDNTDTKKNVKFLVQQRKRALVYEIQKLEKEIESMEKEDSVKKFDRAVQPYLQEYAQEEEIFAMEQNAPRRATYSAEHGIGQRGFTETRETRLNTIVSACLSEVRHDHAPPVDETFEDKCPTCNVPYVLISALASMVCQKCGRKQNYVDASTLCPFGRDSDNSFHYKRIGHFNAYLSLFQAKENAVIPKEILHKVMLWLYNNNYRKTCQIDQDRVRDALSELGLNKYYRNEAQISFLITGRKPPQLTNAQEERLRLRFHAIQAPFRKHRPPDRKSFFSYPYVVYKFCEIEGWLHFLSCIRLHKGGDKRKNLDKIWKKVCHELDGQDPTMTWPYYDTPAPFESRGALWHANTKQFVRPITMNRQNTRSS